MYGHGSRRTGEDRDTPPDRAADFKLERYKYILQQIHSLNENLHRYLTVFQALATAIVTAGVAVFVGWRKLEIGADVARAAVRGLLVLLVLLALFVIVSVVAGMFSWLDYRREEAELLDVEVAPRFRSVPKTTNLWRWYETWVVVFVVVFTIATAVFAEREIIPRIRQPPPARPPAVHATNPQPPVVP